jgi:uncharacterized membrane protein YuzA (DUF378 family)
MVLLGFAVALWTLVWLFALFASDGSIATRLIYVVIWTGGLMVVAGLPHPLRRRRTYRR